MIFRTAYLLYEENKSNARRDKVLDFFIETFWSCNSKPSSSTTEIFEKSKVHNDWLKTDLNNEILAVSRHPDAM